MKNISIFSIFVVLFTLYLLTSCEKHENNSDILTNGNGDNKSSVIYDSIDVSIDENISVDSELCDSLNVDDFNIKPGSYYLVFNTQNPFGTVTFDIESSSREIMGPGVGIKVKVAKIHTWRCPECDCCCGIGFRCGFVKWNGSDFRTATEAVRYLDATITFNTANSSTMTVKMEEEIPIGDTGWEL